MARLGEVIARDSLPESEEFEVLPAGWYDATVKAAELLRTKSGDGQYIKLRLDITGPRASGRVVFTNINIRNQSVDAERIGRQNLGVLMKIAGLEIIEDTDQLIGLPLSIKLSIRKSDQYGEQNEVRGFRELESGVPKATGQWAVMTPKADDDAMSWDPNEASAVKNTVPAGNTLPWGKR